MIKIILCVLVFLNNKNNLLKRIFMFINILFTEKLIKKIWQQLKVYYYAKCHQLALGTTTLT